MPAGNGFGSNRKEDVDLNTGCPGVELAEDSRVPSSDLPPSQCSEETAKLEKGGDSHHSRMEGGLLPDVQGTASPPAGC